MSKSNHFILKSICFIMFLVFFKPCESVGQNALLDSIQRESSKTNIMTTVSYFADVYGPRFFGTPNYYQSLLFAQKKLDEYGIKSNLENFNNEYRGWDFSSYKVVLSSPNYFPINAYPLAFSRSTQGQLEGDLVFINTLQEGYDLKGQLKGKIILFNGLYQPVKSVEGTFSNRLSDDLLHRAKANTDPNDVIIGYYSRVSVPELMERREDFKNRIAKFHEYLDKEGVIATIEPSDYPYGILHVDGNRSLPSFRKIDDINPLPSFTISNEHFGRLLRLKKHGFNPKLKLQLESKYYSDSNFHQNLIAEIPGSDPELKDELVIIGAHLDSWHAGTGAADNASNCAVLMEALRILNHLEIKPKRTIRLALWGGEEQIFAGSEFYVNTHVGNIQTGEPQYEKSKISAYLNLDNGAGKIRGIYLMGNDKVKHYFAEFLKPFPESNFLTIQNANQTDHWLFDYHNIPAFQFIQDPLDYISAIHHSNADLYEYVPENDQEFNADLVAYLVYQIANEKSMLPRKPYNYILPNNRGNVVFSLKNFKNAKRVSVVGNFNNWDMFNLPMYKTNEGWEMKLELPKGKYFYKFIVDGQWTSNPETPLNELVKDGKGHGGLTTLFVK